MKRLKELFVEEKIDILTIGFLMTIRKFKKLMNRGTSINKNLNRKAKKKSGGKV